MKYFVTIDIEFQDHSIEQIGYDHSIEQIGYDHVIAQNSTEAIVSTLRKFNEEASEMWIYDYSIRKVKCERMSDLL